MWRHFYFIFFKNDTFKLIVAIIVSWHIITGLLTIIAHDKFVEAHMEVAYWLR